MADIVADSHGAVLAAAGGTAAGDTDLGDITLPAGGPWKIWGIWGHVVPATATPAELIGGHLRMQSKSGDMQPDPAPCKIPLPKQGSSLGATVDQSVSPLIVYPIDFDASGKAVIDLIYHQDIACTVAPQVVAGILFGKTIPEQKRFRFSDVVRTTLTAIGDTAVGTITLAEKASEIIGITCELTQDGVLTTAEELLGYFRLSSDDVNLAPAQFPPVACYGAGLGALIMSAAPPPVMPIPLSIPVIGGSRIDCFANLSTAVTNGAQASVTLWYI
jgi:hypothetical protein